MGEDEFGPAATADEEERKANGEAEQVYPRPRRKKRATPPPLDDTCTQKVNGERFAFTFGGRLRYLTDRKVWLHWDGKRWAPATEGELLRSAKIVVDQLLVEAYDEADEDRRKRLIKWALECCSVHQLRAMITMATSELALEAKSSDFDHHHHLLNVANGTIDLRDGSIREHDRSDFITRLVPIAYNPSAVAPRWSQYLNEVFAGNEGVISYVKRAVGYSITGCTNEHAFFILYGSGLNGKTVFIRRLEALGGDVARATSFATFTFDRGRQIGNTPELAELAGMRIVTASEPDEGVRLSESVIKQLTGQDTIMVCKKYESPFTFVPTFKIWLATNHKPEIRGVDLGIWRRPRLIPFTVSFEGKADKDLDNKLDAEMCGILHWAVDGARDWYANGLGECEAVVSATSAYREESDPLGAFLGDCITAAPGRFTSNAELYRVYERWSEANGTEPWARNTFALKFRGRGYRDKKKAGVRGFVGIRAEMPQAEGGES